MLHIVKPDEIDSDGKMGGSMDERMETLGGAVTRGMGERVRTPRALGNLVHSLSRE